MNNNPDTNSRKWKRALKWTSLALVAAVVLDWLLDGRLRKRLPGTRRDRSDNL